MFEREIHMEKQRLLRLLLPGAEPFVWLEQILSLPDSELPYKRYLWAEIQWQLYEEELLRQRHPYFDYSAPELAPLLGRLKELLPHYARFPRSELELVVDSAVKVRLNFLCRPRTTLKWFVFRGEPLKSREEILRRLDYLSDYPYLLSGIRNHVQQLELEKGDGLLSVIEFERTVQLVDDSVLELTPLQFLELVQPLELFFRIASLDAPPNHLPTAALVIFLDDKGIRFLAHELEELLRRQHLRWISHTQFLEFVARLLEELETPTDTRTLPLEFPSDTDSTTESPVPAPQTAPEALSQTNPPAVSDAPGSEEPAPNRAEESPQETPLDTPPIETTPPHASTAETDTLYPEILREWLSPPAPAEVLWHDGTLDPEILQSTWKRTFPTEPEDRQALPTPLPQSTGESTPEPLPTASAAPEPSIPPGLRQLLDSPVWRRRYVRSLFPSEEALSAFVQELLQCPNWKAAAALLDRSFAAYGIDPTTRLAAAFRQEILHHYSTGVQHELH